MHRKQTKLAGLNPNILIITIYENSLSAPIKRNWQSGLMTIWPLIHDMTHGPNYMLFVRSSLQI